MLKEQHSILISLFSHLFTSMKIPSTPTATEVLAMHGISSRSPPLATPPPSSLQNRTQQAPI